MRAPGRVPLFLCLLVGLARVPASRGQEGTDLAARIDAVRVEAGLPALGAALVTLDGLQDLWVTGTRRAGGEERVEAGDLWHLGSCTKSMTATLIALLVARGDLAWETELGELLPELATEMDVAYLDLTLVELLCHRTGLPANPGEADFLSQRLDSASLVEQRETLTRTALASAPLHAPRGAFLYSNLGFVIAGHIAEVATRKPWETLIRELLFEPLGMASAGFGPPGSTERCDQPRAHTSEGRPIEPGPLADNPAVYGPAGTVHASLADWAKYVRLHLAGARGDVEVGALTLTRDTFARLHTPYAAPGQGYGFGWVMESRPWAGGDGAALWHNGSNTLWYCVTWLGPGNGVAALVTTNQASPEASRVADLVATLVIKEFQRRQELGQPR